MSVTLHHGRWQDHLPSDGGGHLAIVDPPYGDTSLSWDRTVHGWVQKLPVSVEQVWCFGSMRFHMEVACEFRGPRGARNFTYGQEVIWEKHNGSGFATDRFRRVHEIAMHWYRGTWGALHHVVPTTADATARQVRRKTRPTRRCHRARTTAAAASAAMPPPACVKRRATTTRC